MKTKLVLSLLLSLNFCLLSSQIPQGFNYQAIARDGSGNPITGQTMQVKIGILSDTIANIMVWEELFNPVKTNAFGMFNIVVGTGVKQSGSAASFSAIDWTKTPLFLRTSIYYPSAWKTMGTSKLQSVPYSMVAANLEGTVPLLSVKGNTTTMDSALFVVRNNTGQIVFAVYNEGVRVYVDDGVAKGSKKGGFAIGSFDKSKGTSQPLFVVDPDSIRAYIDTGLVKSRKGGFAIGSFDKSKAGSQQFFQVTQDSIRMYINDSPSKAVKGGFAIGGFDKSKGTQLKYMKVTDDSTRIFVNQDLSGSTGGFKIGGRIGTNINADAFTSLTPDNYLIGQRSGKAITTGKYNSFLGYETGIANTTGNYNTFLGYQSGFSNSDGIGNVFIGYQSGYSNLGGGSTDNLGYYNIFIGNLSGYYNTQGHENVFLGFQAGYGNLTGEQNVFVGKGAGQKNTTGSINTFLGMNAGFSNTTGDRNVFLGWETGQLNTTGFQNVFIGDIVGYKNTTGTLNVCIGSAAGYGLSTGQQNICIGWDAGYASTSPLTGLRNILIGSNAGESMTSGGDNVMIGPISGWLNTIGSRNVFIGDNVGESFISGNDNILIGTGAGLEMANDSDNICIGPYAGAYETGSNKLYIGNSSHNPPLIYGDFSTGNVGIGKTTPASKLDVAGDIRSTNKIWADVSGASTSYFRGGDDAELWDVNIANTLAIYGVENPAVATLRLGNSSADISGSGGNVGISTTTPGYKLTVNGTAWCSSGAWTGSDIRWKKNITEINGVLYNVLALRPVSYQWRTDEFPEMNFTNNLQIGLIAQDVEKVFPNLVMTDNNGYKAVSYEKLSVVLAEAMKEQQQIIEKQQAAIDHLKSLETEVSELKTLVNSLVANQPGLGNK